MNLEHRKYLRERVLGVARYLCVAGLCSALILPGAPLLFASASPVPLTQAPVSTIIPAEQLDALVAPIALYPDNLLAQVFVASTYPLELIQLHQWLQKNADLAKDQTKLNAAVAKMPWDPSIQSMASLPDVVKWLAEDVQWTSDLGNAFLSQQKDVMDAVQRMRAKAKEKGTLASNDKMKVETQVIESKQVIVIEPSNPEVLYVPSYDPVYVYGSIGYPYPPIYYPPYYYGSGAYWAAGAIGFGLGLAWGAAWGGWGWGCGWGGGDIDMNINNNFNRNNNINGGNRPGGGRPGGVGGVGRPGGVGGVGGAGRPGGVGGVGGAGRPGGVGGVGGAGRPGGVDGVGGVGGPGSGGKWQHNPSHRGAAPYGDRGTADRFGGNARGDSIANRQSGARNQIGRQGGNLGSARSPGGGFTSRGNAPGIGGASNRASGIGNRGGSGFGSSSGVGNRSSGLGSSNRSSGLGSGGRSGGFNSGSSGNWGGSGTRMNSSRGSSSRSSSRSGGFGGSRGGGMSRVGGGGMRGGGGGRGGRR
jgi:hypothetical protein